MIFFMALPEYAPKKHPVTTALRAHWDHLARVLSQAGKILARLPEIPQSELHTELYFLDDFFFDGLKEHLEAETKGLFRVAEELKTDDAPITARLREENARLRELVGQFHRLSQPIEKDIPALQQTGQQLLHLMQGHLEMEITVLFPYLDARLSDEEVERKLVRPMLDHNY